MAHQKRIFAGFKQIYGSDETIEASREEADRIWRFPQPETRLSNNRGEAPRSRTKEKAPYITGQKLEGPPEQRICFIPKRDIKDGDIKVNFARPTVL
jgi:hypothetical protein